MIAARRATSGDAADVARLLHAFNTEFGSTTPGESFLEQRVSDLVGSEEITVMLVGDGPEGVAVLRFRPALWANGLDAHLEELYVVPERRGQGLGRALLDAAIDAAREAGAVRIDLGTEEADTAARALYESSGFTNFDVDVGGRGGQMLFYEREL